MDTLYIFWDFITYYKAKSVHFLGLMNSATKLGFYIFCTRVWACFVVVFKGFLSSTMGKPIMDSTGVLEGFHKSSRCGPFEVSKP